MEQRKSRQRTSFREVATEVFPEVVRQANRAGMVTVGWSLGSRGDGRLYLMDGEDNLCEGWETTHDAKVGLWGFFCAFRLVANSYTFKD